MNAKSAELGVRDQINLQFSKQVFKFHEEKIEILKSGEDLPKHMDQDVPEMLVQMEKEEKSRMFNPFLELKGFFMINFLIYKSFINQFLFL